MECSWLRRWLKSKSKINRKAARPKKSSWLRLEQLEVRLVPSVARIIVNANQFSGTEGTAIDNTTALATFTDSNPSFSPSDFTIAIDWGDQHTGPGTATQQGSSGTFVVFGSHTYADEGSFAFTVKVTDGFSGMGSGSSTATMSEADVLSATVGRPNGSLAAVEGIALSSQVATFTTSYFGNTANDFIAMIDWGDGTSLADITSGTISGSNGTFTVSGTHTYADEASHRITVTVADDGTGTATASDSGIITVAEADSLSISVSSFSASEGSAFTSQVATFTTTNTANTASDFSVVIDWGDNTSTGGGIGVDIGPEGYAITGASGSFTVMALHSYADEGSFSIAVTVADDTPGSAMASGSGVITAAEADSLSLSVSSFSVSEGNLLSTTVATFTSTYKGNAAADFNAQINWGDGTSVADIGSGSIIGTAGAFTVLGSHTYADEGSYPVTVSITEDASGSASVVGSGSATIVESDSLSVSASSFSASEGNLLNTKVATFASTYTGNSAGDFSALIDWGDGTSVADVGSGSITGGSGNFTVSGTHSYSEEGSYSVAVLVIEDGAGTAQGSGSGVATVAEASLSVSVNTVSSVAEGTTLSGPVAVFTDSGSPHTGTAFTATIKWGDNATTTGSISGNNGSYTVTGLHTYADEGTNTVVVTVSENGIANSATSGSALVRVTEADSLSATGTAFSVSQGASFTGQVANFTDTYTANTASDFTAIINWGDGTSSNPDTSSGNITGGSGHFVVSGTHTYATSGSFVVTVAISEDAEGSASATARTSAKVINPLGSPAHERLAKAHSFWRADPGQKLINSFNGGALANWLATTFPHLYGTGAGSHNLAGKTNAQIASFVASFFKHGPALDIEVLGVALDVYATTSSLGGSAGTTYGFEVTSAGLGNSSYNVGANGAAFGVPNNTYQNVIQLLMAVDNRASSGVLYSSNPALRSQALAVFQGIVMAGTGG